MNSQPPNPAADNGASAWPRRASKVRRYGLDGPSIVDPTKCNRLVRVAGALTCGDGLHFSTEPTTGVIRLGAMVQGAVAKFLILQPLLYFH
jgi:hypothetical protein